MLSNTCLATVVSLIAKSKVNLLLLFKFDFVCIAWTNEIMECDTTVAVHVVCPLHLWFISGVLFSLLKFERNFRSDTGEEHSSTCNNNKHVGSVVSSQCLSPVCVVVVLCSNCYGNHYNWTRMLRAKEREKVGKNDISH